MQQPAGELTAAIHAAAGAGARLRVRGSGQWWAPAPPATRELRLGPEGASLRVDGGDLVVTAGAAIPLDTLDAALAEHGAWLALDPPGPPGRSLGGALASGGGGPLSAGFGPPRDQVLGLTLVTGNGEQVKTGGRVVKNVAGFDLAKLLVGSHGAFGVIVEAHLRLRVRPTADTTATWNAPREALARMAAALMARGLNPAAFEVTGSEPWALRVRAMGSAVAVNEELAACEEAIGQTGRRTDGQAPWDGWRSAMGVWPVLLRIGADPNSWNDAVTLAEQTLGTAGAISATIPRGTVRVGLTRAEPRAIATLRASAATRGWPVTLERADDLTLRSAGVWGALEPGTHKLTERLRNVFDPNGVFDVPLLADGQTGRRADGP